MLLDIDWDDDLAVLVVIEAQFGGQPPGFRDVVEWKLAVHMDDDGVLVGLFAGSPAITDTQALHIGVTEKLVTKSILRFTSGFQGRLDQVVAGHPRSPHRCPRAPLPLTGISESRPAVRQSLLALSLRRGGRDRCAAVRCAAVWNAAVRGGTAAMRSLRWGADYRAFWYDQRAGMTWIVV